jgi:hypothetical protein
VTLSPTSESLALSGTQVFTATITGTNGNAALNWYVNGVLNGSAAQGTLTACTTTAPLTCKYTVPPIDVPSPNPAVIKVASAADPGKYKTASVTVTDPIAVTLSPTSASLALSGTQVFTATISGTNGNAALNWYVNGVLKGNATEGTLTACTTTAPLTCTYTAPSISVPNPNPAVITVASAADPSKSKTANVTVAVPSTCGSGNDAVLSGQYAFSLSGFNETGFEAELGSFTADGSGHITAGEVDSNGALGNQHADITTSTSSYTVGTDNRGCATIVTPFYTFKTRFSLGTFSSGKATEGRMIEWETGASAYIAAGHILQQTSVTGGLSGNYAFEQMGMDSVSSSYGFGLVGELTAGSGSITAGEMDMNDAGTNHTLSGLTGTYSSPDANGRITSTMTWSGVNPGTSVFYMVSGSHFLILGTDSPTNPIAVGELKQQSGTFSNSSANATEVFYMMGLDGSSSGGESAIGFFKPNGSGSVPVTIYDDDAGTWQTPTPATFTCTYSVAANGRMTISGSNSNCTQAPVFYLTAANSAFMLNTGSSVQIGQVEPQVGSSFTAASVTGALYEGDLAVVNHAAEVGLGVVTLNGSGGIDVTNDYTETTSQNGDETSTGTITVNSNGTIISPDHPGLVVGIIISSTKLVIIDNQGSTYPAIQVIKQ